MKYFLFDFSSFLEKHGSEVTVELSESDTVIDSLVRGIHELATLVLRQLLIALAHTFDCVRRTARYKRSLLLSLLHFNVERHFSHNSKRAVLKKEKKAL